MFKFLLRPVAMLLIPCLLADPASGAAFSHPSFALNLPLFVQTTVTHSVFREQALISTLVGAQRYSMNLKGGAVRIGVMVIGMLNMATAAEASTAPITDLTGWHALGLLGIVGVILGLGAEPPRKEDGIKLKSAFPFPLSEGRKKALGWFQQEPFPSLAESDLLQLFQSDDRVLHQVGLYALRHQSELASQRVYDLLEPQLQSPDPGIESDTLEALFEIDPRRAWPLLENRVSRKDSEIRTALARIFERSGTDEARQLLNQMLAHKSDEDTLLASEVVADAMIRVVQKAALLRRENPIDALLGVVEQGQNQTMRLRALRELESHAALEAIPGLEALSEKEPLTPVVLAAAEAVVGILLHHQQWDRLEQYSQHKQTILRKAVLDAILKGAVGEPHIGPLLQHLRHDPERWIARDAAKLMASPARSDPGDTTAGEQPFSPEAAQHWIADVLREDALIDDWRASVLGQLQAEEPRLAGKYGDDFGGFLVVGSVVKGYALESKSDMDTVVITVKPKIVMDAVSSLKDRHLPIDWLQLADSADVPLMRRDLERSRIDWAFTGFTFGYSKKLREWQRGLLSRVSLEQWAQLVTNKLDHETNLSKLFDRFGITDPVQRQRIQMIAALRRVPPGLEEARLALELNERADQSGITLSSNLGGQFLSGLLMIARFAKSLFRNRVPSAWGLLSAA
jgi:hypothetical protein